MAQTTYSDVSTQVGYLGSSGEQRLLLRIRSRRGVDVFTKVGSDLSDILNKLGLGREVWVTPGNINSSLLVSSESVVRGEEDFSFVDVDRLKLRLKLGDVVVLRRVGRGDSNGRHSRKVSKVFVEALMSDEGASNQKNVPCVSFLQAFIYTGASDGTDDSLDIIT